jgi:hypothetical protein
MCCMLVTHVFCTWSCRRRNQVVQEEGDRPGRCAGPNHGLRDCGRRPYSPQETQGSKNPPAHQSEADSPDKATWQRLLSGARSSIKMMAAALPLPRAS